jgi:putative transposase
VANRIHPSNPNEYVIKKPIGVFYFPFSKTRTSLKKRKSMANTFTHLHIHLVFAVKFRQGLIEKEWKDRLHRYITGIVQQNDHKLIQINSLPDHIHILIGLRTHQAIAALVKNVKTESTKWINQNGFCKTHFAWQEGYGAFACSKSHVDRVIRYIQNQEIHHQQQSFLDEYRQTLDEHEIPFEEKYLFNEPE